MFTRDFSEQLIARLPKKIPTFNSLDGFLSFVQKYTGEEYEYLLTRVHYDEADSFSLNHLMKQIISLVKTFDDLIQLSRHLTWYQMKATLNSIYGANSWIIELNPINAHQIFELLSVLQNEERSLAIIKLLDQQDKLQKLITTPKDLQEFLSLFIVDINQKFLLNCLQEKIPEILKSKRHFDATIAYIPSAANRRVLKEYATTSFLVTLKNQFSSLFSKPKLPDNSLLAFDKKLDNKF